MTEILKNLGVGFTLIELLIAIVLIAIVWCIITYLATIFGIWIWPMYPGS